MKAQNSTHIIPKTYSSDMDEFVRCPSCNKILKFGDGYTSRKITNKAGFGYCVCESCYEKETEKG